MFIDCKVLQVMIKQYILYIIVCYRCITVNLQTHRWKTSPGIHSKVIVHGWVIVPSTYIIVPLSAYS